MKTKILYKISLLLTLFVLTFSFTRCQESEAEHRYNTENTISSEVQAKKDFEEAETAIFKKYKIPEEAEKYYNDIFWNQRVFEDKYHKRNIGIATDFLRKYPKGDYHFKMLKYYLSYLIEPRFLDSTSLTKKQRKILNKHTAIINGKLDYDESYYQLRSLPYDFSARQKWLQQGDSLVQNFLASNAPQDQKAEIEMGKMARDKRLMQNFYQHLNFSKPEEESQFWFLFDYSYWKDIIKRMDDLILKYPDYKTWPRDVDLFISRGIALPFLSPELEVPLWEHFRDLTNKPKLFKQHPILAKVHEKAQKNIKAIKMQENFDESRPLQMQLITMDGKKIDLKDYKGKVVLLDFWSIGCAPCIKEMPHIQAMYDKYKDQGFEVIGVSAESDAGRERVIEIIKKQGANWPQVLDKGADAIVSYQSLFKIHSWPTTWLLNKEGVIVDKNARGNRLEPLIQKYLHLEQEESS